MRVRRGWRSGFTVLFLAVVFLGGCQDKATPPAERYFARLYPESLPQNGGTAFMILRVWQSKHFCRQYPKWCEKEEGRHLLVSLREDKTNRAELLRDWPWVIHLDDDFRYEETLSVRLAPDDTCTLQLSLANERDLPAGTRVYWVTGPDTTEVWYHYPGAHVSHFRNCILDSSDVLRAWINLSNERQRRYFLQIAALEHPLFGTPVLVDDSGLYHFRGTHYMIQTMIDLCWDVGFIDTPPPLPSRRAIPRRDKARSTER
jgi:hypothetical protein